LQASQQKQGGETTAGKRKTTATSQFWVVGAPRDVRLERRGEERRGEESLM